MPALLCPTTADVPPAAVVLGIGRTKTFEMLARGELPVVRIGRAVRVPRQALYRWIESRTVRADKQVAGGGIGMGRRGNGEGCIYQRADGRWCAAVTIEAGRRRALYGRTRQEVADKLNNPLDIGASAVVTHPPAEFEIWLRSTDSNREPCG